MPDMKLLRELNRQANAIIDNDDIEWEEKYDLIFCESMSRTVFRELRLDYYDPDTTYEEDARAFVNAFNEKMEELERLFDEP